MVITPGISVTSGGVHMVGGLTVNQNLLFITGGLTLSGDMTIAKSLAIASQGLVVNKGKLKTALSLTCFAPS